MIFKGSILMEYFIEAYDKKIYHKETKKLILDSRTVSDYKEAFNGCLLVREKGAAFFNLAFDRNGEQLPHTGEKNISIFLYRKNYEIRTMPSYTDGNDGSVAKRSYPYPHMVSETFSVHYDSTRQSYSFFVKDTCFAKDQDDYKILTLMTRPYLAVKKNNLWTLYNYKGEKDPVIQDVTSIYTSYREPEYFLIGATQKPVKAQQEKKDELFFNLKFYGILGALFTFMATASLYAIQKNQEAINKQEAIESTPATYLRTQDNYIQFDTDNDLSTVELEGYIPRVKNIPQRTQETLQNQTHQPMPIAKWKKIPGLEKMYLIEKN